MTQPMMAALRQKMLGRVALSAFAGAVAAVASIPWAFLALFPVLWFAFQPLRLPQSGRQDTVTVGTTSADQTSRVGPLYWALSFIAVSLGAALGWVAGAVTLR